MLTVEGKEGLGVYDTVFVLKNFTIQISKKPFLVL